MPIRSGSRGLSQDRARSTRAPTRPTGFSGNPDIVPVTAQGTYGTTGFRYEDPNDKLNDAPDAGFTGGESFSIPGTFDAAFNDLHGTTIAGVLAAARNGTGMQGVANGSTVYIGNSGGTDHMDDGPNQDYDYFKAVYGAVATEGARADHLSVLSFPERGQWQEGLHELGDASQPSGEPRHLGPCHLGGLTFQNFFSAGVAW